LQYVTLKTDSIFPQRKPENVQVQLAASGCFWRKRWSMQRKNTATYLVSRTWGMFVTF